MCCVMYTICRGQQATGVLPADSLVKDAVAIKRMDETVVEIVSPKKARLHTSTSYTILSSAGDMYATTYVLYDKFHQLNSASGILYDANGKVLKKIRKNDMEDRSAEGAGTLVTDMRVKYYHFSCRSYPYTVHYEQDIDLDGVFILPSWQPQPSPRMSVQNARLIVKAPAGYPLRYRQYHYPGEAAIAENNGDKTYTWEISNRPAVTTEMFAPSWPALAPAVYLAPGDFEIEGYKGHMYSWSDMAAFIRALWKDRDHLPEEAKKKVHELTDGLKDGHEKINVLYDFLQKNTHYVGIQLGIGGWQPFDAAYVYNKRFGDCKALANYMVALLNEAGISGNYVLIRAGADAPALDTGFACSQFNHAIVVAYTGRDSVWLECTSQTLPAGYLGSFTADRHALLINETGGHIVHTPVYGMDQNRLQRTLRGRIDSSGGLQADMHTLYTGMEQEDLHFAINRLSQKEQADRARDMLGISNCTVTGLFYRETRSAIPSIEESLQLSAENFATLSGSRLFITPGAFLKKPVAVRQSRQPRKNNFVLDRSVQEADSVILQVPPGYTLEENPAPVNFSAPFGSYHFHSTLSGQTLTITCTCRIKKGEYEAALFPRLERFFDLMRKEDNNRLVLVRQ